MNDLFLSVLNMSLTASYVIAAILLIRLSLKNAPKTISYALWAVAGFRLAVPFSFENMLSLIPFKAEPATNIVTHYTGEPIEHIIISPDWAPPSDIGTISGAMISTPAEVPAYFWIHLAGEIWLIGIAALLIYSVVSIILLKRQLSGAVLSEVNIYEAENLKTPFVLGFIRPKIYIPARLSTDERSYIILHEQTHIKRFDHVVKLAAFFILCVHWFNPLVWIAFILMSADMEMSCDERVLNEMGSDIKKAYSSSLLSMATGRCLINGGPLAFGEGNIKGRIKNILNFKKPAAWVIAVSVVLVAALSIGFAANQKSAKAEPDLSLLNYKNLATLAYQADYLTVLHAPGITESFDIPARAIAEYLDSADWTVMKTDTSLELAADIQIEWNEDLELHFFESEPLLAMTRINEQWRYYSIGKGDYEKMLALLRAESDGPVAVRVDVTGDIPEAVIDYAKDYVGQQVVYYNDVGKDFSSGMGTYTITEARITGLTQMNTGTANLNKAISMWLLEYRLLPDNPDKVPLAGGMQMEEIDGQSWITEWGSTGQPYLLLESEYFGAELIWRRICVTNTDIIMVDYGTPEMLELYGNAYTAAAMELYKDNTEAGSMAEELYQTADEKDAKIKRYEKEYELRNILDIEARKLLSALNSGIFGESEKNILHDNIIVKEDRLAISYQDHDNEILFFQNKLDFKQVRQRYYHLDDQGKFITGYEVINISDDINERISSQIVLVFTFSEEPSGWKLVDLGIDK